MGFIIGAAVLFVGLVVLRRYAPAVFDLAFAWAGKKLEKVEDQLGI